MTFSVVVDVVWKFWTNNDIIGCVLKQNDPTLHSLTEKDNATDAERTIKQFLLYITGSEVNPVLVTNIDR